MPEQPICALTSALVVNSHGLSLHGQAPQEAKSVSLYRKSVAGVLRRPFKIVEICKDLGTCAIPGEVQRPDLMRPTLGELVEAGLTDERRQFLALLKLVHQHDWGLVARTALTAGSMVRLLEDGLSESPGGSRDCSSVSAVSGSVPTEGFPSCAQATCCGQA